MIGTFFGDFKTVSRPRVGQQIQQRKRPLRIARNFGQIVRRPFKKLLPRVTHDLHLIGTMDLDENSATQGIVHTSFQNAPGLLPDDILHLIFQFVETSEVRRLSKDPSLAP